MDLALEVGTTDGELARTMTEGEFRGWQRYAATRRLPMRRLELYLAQIALTVARSAGGENLSLQDFLLEDAALVTESDVDDMKAELNFRPINRKG